MFSQAKPSVTGEVACKVHFLFSSIGATLIILFSWREAFLKYAHSPFMYSVIVVGNGLFIYLVFRLPRAMVPRLQLVFYFCLDSRAQPIESQVASDRRVLNA